MNIIVPKGKKVLITMGGVSQVAGVIEAILATTISPTITLNGEYTIDLKVGGTYTEAGATAVDSNGNTLSVAIAGSVDTNNAGIYWITYKATDANGKSMEITRSVFVEAINTNFLYVSTTGSDSNNGTSKATAFKTLQKGIDTATAGTTIYAKAGNYGNEHLRFKRSGTRNSPIVLKGYKTTPGDTPVNTTIGKDMVLSGSVMPMLDGGSRVNAGQAVGIVNVEYITVENIEIMRFTTGVLYRWGDMNHKHLDRNGLGVHFKNLLIRDIGASRYGINALSRVRSNYSSTRNCVVINSSENALVSMGNYNEVNGNKVFSTFTRQDGTTVANTKAERTGYSCVNLGNNNKIHHNYIQTITERGNGEENVGHGMHGVSIMTQKNTNSTNRTISDLSDTYTNEVYKNEVVGTNTGIELRYGVNDNYVHDNILKNCDSGLDFTEGCLRNVVKNISITCDVHHWHEAIKHKTWIAVRFHNEGGNKNADMGKLIKDNTVDNILIDGAVYAFRIENYLNSGVTMPVKDNIFTNLTVKNISRNLLNLTTKSGGISDITGNTLEIVEQSNINNSTPIAGFTIS